KRHEHCGQQTGAEHLDLLQLFANSRGVCDRPSAGIGRGSPVVVQALNKRRNTMCSAVLHTPKKVRSVRSIRKTCVPDPRHPNGSTKSDGEASTVPHPTPPRNFARHLTAGTPIPLRQQHSGSCKPAL